METISIERLIEVLNYLDGRGIIFTDENLVREAWNE